MITWATIIALVSSAFVYASAPSSLILEIAELGGVIALFMLICAAEAFSTPRS